MRGLRVQARPVLGLDVMERFFAITIERKLKHPAATAMLERAETLLAWRLAFSGRAGTPFLNSAASEVDGRISPDGRLVAYVSNDTERFEIYVVSSPSGTDRIQVSSDGGFRPEWAPQGNEILFRSPGGWMMSATFQGNGAPRARKPRILFDASKYENVYSVAPDGKRFLMMPLLPMEGDATEIRVILNVQAEIRRRIPE